MTLRQDVISYESQQQCEQINKNKLLIRFPVLLGEEENLNSEWLDLFSSQQFDADDTDDYLYLRLFPEYTQENDVFGEGKLKNTFNSAAVYSHSTVRRGFKAVVTDRRLLIFSLIKRIIENSRTSSFTVFTPVKVIDFCLPETGEYTIRFGSINYDRIPGIRGSHLRGDWEFTFKESILRNV